MCTELREDVSSGANGIREMHNDRSKEHVSREKDQAG